MVTILPYHDAFAAEFYRLNREWITENFVLEPLDEQVLSNPRQSILDTGGEIWCACNADGVMIGCYALLPLADGRLEFTKFAVDTQLRGQGAGSKLLTHAIARAREKNVPELILYTNTLQQRACEMYVRYGFIATPMSEDDKTRYARANLFMVLSLAATFNEASHGRITLSS
jgi:N-acetylglutamate synthase-like GNAT family acetyltransferase